MRTIAGTVSVVVLSLACGGSLPGMEAPPEPVDIEPVRVHEPVVPLPMTPPAPAPAPAPEPEPEPMPPALDVLATLARSQRYEMAVVCTRAGEVVPCPTGPCLECPGGPEVSAIATVTLSEGRLALPLATATLTAFDTGTCKYIEASVIEGDTTTAARPVAAVAQDDAALAPIRSLDATATIVSAWRLDLDGSPGDEIVAEVTTSRGSLLAVARTDGSTVVPFDGRREPLPEGTAADEAAVYEMEEVDVSWLGVTDAENDGVLEFVIHGSGMWANWIDVIRLDGKALGRPGCGR